MWGSGNLPRQLDIIQQYHAALGDKLNPMNPLFSGLHRASFNHRGPFVEGHGWVNGPVNFAALWR